jgi:hypothetical protein
MRLAAKAKNPSKNPLSRICGPQYLDIYER